MREEHIIEGEVVLDDENSSKEENDRCILSVTDLSSEYRSLHDQSIEYGRNLNKNIKFGELEDANSVMTDALLALGSFNKTEEGKFKRLTRAIFGSKRVDEFDEKTSRFIIEGKTVAEVSEDILKILSEKKNKVDNIFKEIAALRDNILSTGKKYDSIRKELKLNIEEEKYNTVERYEALNLIQEIEEMSAYMSQNLHNANGLITAAEQNAPLFTKVMTQLKINIGDALAIQGAMKNLKELTGSMDILVEALHILQVETNDGVHTQLVEVLDNTASKKQTDRVIEILQNQSNSFSKINDKILSTQKEKALQLERLSTAYDQSKLLGNNSKQTEGNLWSLPD